LENSPQVFGLHPNADAGYLWTATEQLWSGLVELMPRSTGEEAKGESRESVLEKLCHEVLSQTPEPFDRKIIMKNEREKARNNGFENLQPVQVVLVQEVERWNQLVICIASTLKNLQKALAGTIGMSAELDDIAVSLSNGQLPSVWRRLAPATRKNLGRWMVHFQRRYEQFRKWIDHGEPMCMWISGLTIPESYLSALIQSTCRKYVWPLDRSTMYTRVTTFVNAEEIKEPAKDGAYISGLYIEGAKWDERVGCLVQQERKKLIYELPVIEVIPQEVSKLKLVGTIRAPVYVTRDRRNAAGVGLVFEADLTSKNHSSHWILESVALCLNSDD